MDSSNSTIDNNNDNDNTNPSKHVVPGEDDDTVIELKIPYADPYRAGGYARVYTNAAFWRTVSHLKWLVIQTHAEYVVCPHETSGFCNMKYMHIMCVRYYEEDDHFGPRRLPAVIHSRSKKRAPREYTVDHINKN